MLRLLLSSELHRPPMSPPRMPPRPALYPPPVGRRLVVLGWIRTRWGIHLFLQDEVTDIYWTVVLIGGYPRPDDNPPPTEDTASEGGE